MVGFQTPRGTRDFLPEEMIAREEVFATVKKVFERYGFYPLETPAFEEMGVLTAKCGEDVAKQIYGIADSNYGLRFDLTVPLARVVASNWSLPKPFKRYQIGPVWRRDEPQKGRFREFWQADVDVVGSTSMRCDAECLAAACEALRELGFDGFIVRLNNRKLLDAMVEKAGVARERAGAVFRALDKLEKIGEEGVRAELKGKAGLGDEEAERLMSFAKISGSNEEKMRKMAELVGETRAGKEGMDELRELISLFSKYEVSKGCEVIVDFSLVRGLDYYTGPIFEVKVPEGGVGSVAGGGRYDGLIELYGAPPSPATGISLGIERIMEVKRSRGTLAKKKTRCAIFVAPVKPEFLEYGFEILQKLRGLGVNAEIDLMERTLRKQLDYANAMGIPFAAIVGEREKKDGKLTLRNLRSGEERFVSVEEAAREAAKG